MIKKCPYCNHTVSEDMQNCPQCGESLKTQCPYCKEQISVLDKKCQYCDSKLTTGSISIVITITYALLLLNALIPYWFSNSIYEHPVFWHSMIAKRDDFYDLISLIISIGITSSVPAIIGFVYNYRKRVCLISILAMLFFCICNIYLACQIH